MRLFNLLASLAVFAALAGCVTQAQVRAKEMQAQARATLTAFNACGAEKRKSEDYAIVDRIILSDPDPRALQKMALDRLATPREKQAILSHSEAMFPCHQLAIEGFSKVHPLFVEVLARWEADKNAARLKLIRDEITVGQLNEWFNKTRPARKAEFIAIDRKIEEQLGAAHQYETQQRASAIDALQQWTFQQQLLYQNQHLINTLNRPPPPRSTVTDCRYVGSFVRCATH